MKASFLLLIGGLALIYLGLTGRLGAVLAAIFEPGTLTQVNSSNAPVVDTIPAGIGAGDTTPTKPPVSSGGKTTDPTTPDTPSTVDPPATNFDPPPVIDFPGITAA